MKCMEETSGSFKALGKAECTIPARPESAPLLVESGPAPSSRPMRFIYRLDPEGGEPKEWREFRSCNRLLLNYETLVRGAFHEVLSL